MWPAKPVVIGIARCRVQAVQQVVEPSAASSDKHVLESQPVLGEQLDPREIVGHRTAFI